MTAKYEYFNSEELDEELDEEIEPGDNEPDGTNDGDEVEEPDYKQLYEDLQRKMVTDNRKRSVNELESFITESMLDYSDAQIEYYLKTADVESYLKDDGSYGNKVFDTIRESIKEFSVVSPPASKQQTYTDPTMSNGFRTPPKPVSHGDYGRSLAARIGKGKK